MVLSVSTKVKLDILYERFIIDVTKIVEEAGDVNWEYIEKRIGMKKSDFNHDARGVFNPLLLDRFRIVSRARTKIVLKSAFVSAALHHLICSEIKDGC